MVVSSSTSKEIKEGINFSKKFLTTYSKVIEERHRNGMTINGLGDLHSGNIFLLNQPVIFDCIEFNSDLRQIDVLSKLAFLCMGLEFYGQEGLATYFIERYNINYPLINTSTDRLLFLYYKLYRANIRIKINALRAMQAVDTEVKDKYIGLVEDYYYLEDI